MTKNGCEYGDALVTLVEHRLSPGDVFLLAGAEWHRHAREDDCVLCDKTLGEVRNPPRLEVVRTASAEPEIGPGKMTLENAPHGTIVQVGNLSNNHCARKDADNNGYWRSLVTGRVLALTERDITKVIFVPKMAH